MFNVQSCTMNNLNTEYSIHVNFTCLDTFVNDK